MTKAQLDLAHKTVGDLGHCVTVIEQYGNGRIAATMRIAADLLQRMIDEHEAAEQPPIGELIRNARAKGIDVHLADDTPEEDHRDG